MLQTSIRSELQRMRHDYESQDSIFLMMCLRDMGVPLTLLTGMTREEMIERLMALEEHAAFH